MLEKHFPLKKCPLFVGMDPDEIEDKLTCLSASEKTYDKNEYIFIEGDPISSIGIVLSGSVNIFKEDFWGNRSIISYVGVGDLFGESFSFSLTKKIPVNAMATEKSRVLFIDYKNIITTCSKACEFHNDLIKNMLKIISTKNIMLTQKMEHITKRTTREKLLSYLSEQSRRFESNSFEIPFNRQELADYLSVERSAMSNELGKMQSDGLITFNKSHFTLL